MHRGTEGYRDSKFEIRKFDNTNTYTTDKTAVRMVGGLEGRKK